MSRVERRVKDEPEGVRFRRRTDPSEALWRIRVSVRSQDTVSNALSRRGVRVLALIGFRPKTSERRKISRSTRATVSTTW